MAFRSGGGSGTETNLPHNYQEPQRALGVVVGGFDPGHPHESEEFVVVLVHDPIAQSLGRRVVERLAGEAFQVPLQSRVESRCGAVAASRSVSTSRSSNRTCGSPASGFRTRTHAFAHERLRRRSIRFTRPACSRKAAGHWRYPLDRTLCFLRSHRRSRYRTCWSIRRYTRSTAPRLK